MIIITYSASLYPFQFMMVTFIIPQCVYYRNLYVKRSNKINALLSGYQFSNFVFFGRDNVTPYICLETYKTNMFNKIRLASISGSRTRALISLTFVESAA